jgi:hypothetical protein
VSITDIPPTWLKGQLLDLKRFSDGTYRATLLGDVDKPKEGYIAPTMTFGDSYAAQQFVSDWYAPAQRHG